MKHHLTKEEAEKVEFLDAYDDGDTGWICYVRPGYSLRGEDGPAFCEDSFAEVKATLKLVQKT